MSGAPTAAAVLHVSLEARDLAHAYAPGRGLEPTSFSVTAPGVVAVTGRNGSGKSTLLRIVAGLLHPSRGTCTLSVEGRSLEPSQRRAAVGFAAADLAFYEEFTVEENLEFVADARGAPRARESAGNALGRVGLHERRADRVAALSSGMRQRLRLAFAILGAPPLLLLDEPGTHLDQTGRDVVRLLLEDQRRSGLAILATNDEREWKLADQRIELLGGSLGDPA